MPQAELMPAAEAAGSILLIPAAEERDMLEGKRIYVSGAASGIGYAAASVMAGYGASLVLADRDVSGLARAGEALPDSAEVTLLPLDVADEGAVEAAFETIGRLDGAFNNAGREAGDGALVPLAETRTEVFDSTLAVNLRGLFLCLRAQMSLFMEQGAGAVVNTGSVLSVVGAPGMAAYGASKHGVAGLTRIAALEGAPAGVRVNAVCPGGVRTPMLTERAFKANPGYEELAAASHPMGRLAAPEEIAEAAAWLLSDKSSFVTGHVLMADGGLTAM